MNFTILNRDPNIGSHTGLKVILYFFAFVLLRWYCMPACSNKRLWTQARVRLVSMAFLTTQSEVQLIHFAFGCLTGKRTSRFRINERLRIVPLRYTQRKWWRIFVDFFLRELSSSTMHLYFLFFVFFLLIQYFEHFFCMVTGLVFFLFLFVCISCLVDYIHFQN